MTSPKITTFFLDIGGVLLSNGWDHPIRERACEHFDFNFKEMDDRHLLAVALYEEGALDLETYLDLVVFHTKRRFSRDEFKSFMFEQSKPYKEMVHYFRSLKEQYQLKLIAISNEGRELTEYRIKNFGLEAIFDAFVASSFVHLRKPDPAIYRMALDIAQVPPEQAFYIDDRPLLVEAAKKTGIQGLVHREYLTTRKALLDWGFSLESPASTGYTG